MKIIGITGHPGSGKDTIADYFIQKGFKKTGGGDILRAKMRQLGIPIDRTGIREFAKKQRELHGNAYPMGEVIEKITGDTVVTGLRNIAEAQRLKEEYGKDFTLIAVETPLIIRYNRAKERNREGDDITLTRFKEEEREERAADSGSHEVDKVMAIADILIINDNTKEDLFHNLDILFFKDPK